MATLEKGKLSIHTENILPVIKKWLYSENEIFVRELISNAHDAIEKLRRVSMTEDVFEADRTDFTIDIRVDAAKGTLEFEDNGIGMTADEVRKYITQIAFSGAEEFAKKYLQGDPSKADIIGHFGLGFYSSFMVASKVEIESRSYRLDAEPVFWSSDGGEEFEIGPGTKEHRGTIVRLYLNEEFRSEYLDTAKIQSLVRRFCDFLPVKIHVNGAQVNRQQPLWTKMPSSVKKEDYIDFYKYMFPFQEDPLFYIHLNVDYPFRLQGILYFPKLAHEMDLNRSEVKLFCKQVFVTDEASEVIPKFLTVLQGVIDLPELPLNVSRSYIQNDPQVKKIASHIVKKVADRLVEEFKKNRAEYEKIWPEIAPFVKYGMLSDEKFYEQAKDALLLRRIADSSSEKEGPAFLTIDEYRDRNKDRAGERIFYASDLKTQGPAIRLVQKQGIDVVLLDTVIDTHFTSQLEVKAGGLRFVRVDAELTEHAVETSSEIVDADAKSARQRIEEIFRKALPDSKITIRVENLKSDEIPAMILLPETMRRMSEMALLWGQEGSKFPEHHTLLINLKNPLIQKMAKPSLIGSDGDAKKIELAAQIYRTARLSQAALSPEEMQAAALDLFRFFEKFL
jgi:molecular chaperone HtpG